MTLLWLIFTSTFLYANTYLASEVGCQKWKEKRVQTFWEQVELESFIENSKNFFSQAKSVQNLNDLEKIHHSVFNTSMKNINEKVNIKMSYEFNGEELKSVKTFTHQDGHLSSKNSGVESLLDTYRKTKEFKFVMSYNKDGEMTSHVIHEFKDGSKVVFPVEDYLILSMSKSCKRYYKVSESKYLKNQKKLRAPAQKSKKEDSENLPL